MTICTRDFGTMELDENEVVNFLSPIYGFEALTRYILLKDDEMSGGLLWLQSVEKPEVCFILLDPEEVGLHYHPEIPKDVLEMISAKDEVGVRLIAVVAEDFRESTVNLKSPIVINPANKNAAQVILEADYPIRMPLFEEAASC